MADIFISYSKDDRATIEALAKFLEGRGYTTWWDASLVSVDDYRRVIDQQLDAAKAVIVVWSEASAGSKWVISEAEHGARRGTLITLKAPDFDVTGVPKPYGTQHTESVENRPAILAALGKLGVTPRYAPDADGVTPHDWFWNEVSKSNKQSEYELYLREFPEGRHAAVAKLQIARLAAAKGEEAPVERKAMSETSRPARVLWAVGMSALVLTALAGAGFGCMAWQAAQRIEARLAEEKARQLQANAAEAAERAKMEQAAEAEWTKVRADQRPSGSLCDAAMRFILAFPSSKRIPQAHLIAANRYTRDECS